MDENQTELAACEAAERGSDSGALPADGGLSSASTPPEPLFGTPGWKPWQPKKLRPAHLVMIEYHLAGHTYGEIAEHLGCSHIDVGMVIRSDLAKDYIKSRVDDLNSEFHGLFRKVISAVSNGLDNADPEVALKAADKWLRAHGRYTVKKNEAEALTAEEVIQKLMAQRASVTVNVDARQQTFSYRSEPDASA